MLFAAMAANAQEPMTTTTTTSVVPGARMYKPVAGDVLAELGVFAGGIGTNITSPSASPFGTPQLKFRYFIANDLALRVGFNYDKQTDVTRFYEGAPGSGEGSAKEGNSVFGLNAGLEKHFSGTGRLSTYAGGDLAFQKTSASAKWENSNNGTSFSNGDTREQKGVNTAGDVSSTGIGLRGVVGADYYFVEKVYLGAELSWGFIASKNGKQTIDSTVGGVVAPTNEIKSNGGGLTFGTNVSAGLRLGFRF